VDQVQLIVDLQRAFDLLADRPDVDARRLAFIGRSYGAAMGGLLAGVERRPRTYLFIVGDGGLVAHYSAPGHHTELDGLSSERRERWLAAMRPIEPIRHIGCATGASFFFEAARRDEDVTASDAVAFQRATPKPKVVRWYNLDHNLGWPAIIDELDWLHRLLQTAPAGSPAGMWCATKQRCPE
jgi:dienelactone hydrolase